MRRFGAAAGAAVAATLVLAACTGLFGPEGPAASTVAFADGTAVAKTILDAPFTNAASGAGDGALSWTSDAPETASVDAATGEVTIHAVGTANITASRAATADYLAASAAYALTVTLAPSTVVFALGTDVVKQPSAAVFTNAASGAGDGLISWASDTPATATVDAATGEVTVHALGTARITASRAASATYAAAEAAYGLAVVQVGSAFRGGVLAYFLTVRDHGYDAAREHGLIVAPAEATVVRTWCRSPYSSVSVYPTGFNFACYSFGGEAIANAAILAQNGPGTDYAAGYCDAYVNPDAGTGVYDDWYLATRDEFSMLGMNKAAIGGFQVVAQYHTSTEVYHEPGQCILIVPGSPSYGGGAGAMDSGIAASKVVMAYVRPVRSF
jgi:hypothetical protein